MKSEKQQTKKILATARIFCLVPMTGLEPVRPFEARDFKSLASAYSATSALKCGGTTQNRTGE